MTRFPRRTVTCLLAASLLVAACGDDDVDTTATSDTTTTVDDTTTTSTTTAGSVGSSELPGERVDIFPYEDAELAVVGVAADDVLHVRSRPGPDFDVVAELEPTAKGIVATGHNRSVDDGFWVEVDVDGTTGWANVAFLSHLGRTDDITTEIAPTPDDRPRGDTMLHLAEIVAGDRLPEGTPPSELVVVDGPTVGDVGEITVDTVNVAGFGDDAVAGERLRIFAEEGAGGESFVLRSVERTLLCIRGVTEDGLCL